MISKTDFINIMNRLTILEDKMNNADVAIRELSRDFCGLYIPEAIDITMDLFRAMLSDSQYDWLEYCAFERNFLRSIKLGDVLDENKNPIDMSSWDKVYDFLMSVEE